MSQKYIKRQNKNSYNVAYGKYYATAVYDNHFIGTEELAEFIQTQASVKKSDIKAVLDELGAAMKHYFELGQKVKPDGTVKQKYVNAITLLKDVVFEETHDNAMNVEPETPDTPGTGD